MLLLGLLAATSGCKKPEDDLGLSVLDPADTMSTVRTDTLGIIAWPRPDSAVQTSGLSANVLGSYVDDVFGPAAAGIATQVRLSVNNVGPADPGLACDSLVLQLAFSTTDPLYGDLDPQVLKVYRLTEDLAPDSVYKSHRVPAMGDADLVQGSPRQFTPSPTAGPVIGGDSLLPQVRIPLSTDLGNELLGLWGSPTLADNASFTAFFKGLVVQPDNPGQAPLQGGIWRMNLLSGASKLTLYYHDAQGTASSFDFVIGATSARYSYCVFNHAAASLPGLPQALADSTQGQLATYVQAMGSLRTELRFPWLDQYRNGPYKAVAKAELVVPIAGEFHDTYKPPVQLFAFRKADDGADLLVPDQITGQGMVGGFYDADAHAYRFNLTRWVQGVISGTYANTGLSLVPGSNGVTLNRATLAGPLATTTPMKLVLTFTTY